MMTTKSLSALKFIRCLKVAPVCSTHSHFHNALQNNYCTGSSNGDENDKSKRKPYDVDPRSLKSFVSDMYTGQSDEAVEVFPSDEVDLNELANTKKSHTDKSNIANRSGTDPSLTSVLMFPGQGSHFVGMGKKLQHIPSARDVYDRASGILGYDLLELCLKGPHSKLSKTEFSQPAIVVTSLAAVEKLREEKPEAVDACIAAIGFSVGEITALMFAETLSFEDGISLIRLRARAMQRDSEVVSSGMMTAMCDMNTYLKEAMLAAREYCKTKAGIENPVCNVTAFVGTDIKVIAGHTEALDFMQETQKDFGIRHLKRLNVSGAFHTSLMKEASRDVAKSLKDKKFNVGKVPVYSNVTSNAYSTNHKQIKRNVYEQIVKPIKWEQIIKNIYQRSPGTAYPNTYEVGPRRSLGHLLRSTDKKAVRKYKAVDV
ncbi:malonyl-CoA-acyl carrier protein transacylase, mitochondrial-like [Mizuhopecten yessoensis]|uniref:Malonyl-CoA-acyl carrier protein transacylase, mitochondrial n=1 Tax=Mizuhopecten yessoensis TaxID=6573 RepID=A0A210PIC6_MIZYE|nr:malonyl-CoA-acyl carrier protein transacylase, mitochondrial-like [Mizuhopecten yessoensis]OWF36248.1 Malonyl-CoA-acyl carrier protein transacylase, mitochondrial [Mizuhopecten yessoensis]